MFCSSCAILHMQSEELRHAVEHQGDATRADELQQARMMLLRHKVSQHTGGPDGHDGR